MFGRYGLGRYRLENTVKVDQPMILITQIQRSGGTLLSRLMDGHPSLFAHPYELSWGRPEKWHWPMTPSDGQAPLPFKRLDQDWVRRLAKKAYYRKGKKREVSTHPFIFNYGLQKGIYENLERSRSDDSVRQYLNQYLTSFFNAWLDYQSLYGPEERKFVTAFTPRVLMYPESVDGFVRDYPDGYVLSSLRHPAGWYASAIRHKYAGNLEEVLEFWMRSARAIVAAKQRLGDRMIVTDFESLVADPAELMKRVCERTGLPWHDTLAQPTFNGMLIKSNSHYENVTHVDEEAGHRYRKVLPAHDVEAIERISADIYQEAQALIQADRDKGRDGL
jgi:hypothetical protein